MSFNPTFSTPCSPKKGTPSLASLGTTAQSNFALLPAFASAARGVSYDSKKLPGGSVNLLSESGNKISHGMIPEGPNSHALLLENINKLPSARGSSLLPDAISQLSPDGSHAMLPETLSKLFCKGYSPGMLPENASKLISTGGTFLLPEALGKLSSSGSILLKPDIVHKMLPETFNRQSLESSKSVPPDTSMSAQISEGNMKLPPLPGLTLLTQGALTSSPQAQPTSEQAGNMLSTAVFTPGNMLSTSDGESANLPMTADGIPGNMLSKAADTTGNMLSTAACTPGSMLSTAGLKFTTKGVGIHRDVICFWY